MARNTVYSTASEANDLRGAQVRPSGRTRVATSRMVELNDRLAKLLGSAESIGDRLLGSHPIAEATGKPGPHAVANGSLDELHEQISRAEDLVGYLFTQVDRLNEAD